MWYCNWHYLTTEQHGPRLYTPLQSVLTSSRNYTYWIEYFRPVYIDILKALLPYIHVYVHYTQGTLFCIPFLNFYSFVCWYTTVMYVILYAVPLFFNVKRTRSAVHLVFLIVCVKAL